MSGHSEVTWRGRFDPETSPFLSIVIPAYNEEARIGKTLDRMVAYLNGQGRTYEILVISDGSTDGTVEQVEQIASRYHTVALMSYAPNRGKGFAVRYGILHARGQRILFSDADLATPIEELEKLDARLDEGYDVAIGSRDILGSKLLKRQSMIREFGGKTFNSLVRLAVVPGIHDTQCGFKLFTRSAATAVFSQCEVDHFAFDVEALYLAINVFGLRVAEAPVNWTHQEDSKVRFWRDGLRMVKTVVRIRTARYHSGVPISSELYPL